MAKPNYAFAKRQRDLAKKLSKEEKKRRKIARTAEAPPQSGDGATAEPEPSAPGGKPPDALD